MTLFACLASGSVRGSHLGPCGVRLGHAQKSEQIDRKTHGVRRVRVVSDCVSNHTLKGQFDHNGNVPGPAGPHPPLGMDWFRVRENNSQSFRPVLGRGKVALEPAIAAHKTARSVVSAALYFRKSSVPSGLMGRVTPQDNFRGTNRGPMWHETTGIDQRPAGAT